MQTRFSFPVTGSRPIVIRAMYLPSWRRVIDPSWLLRRFALAIVKPPLHSLRRVPSRLTSTFVTATHCTSDVCSPPQLHEHLKPTLLSLTVLMRYVIF